MCVCGGEGRARTSLSPLNCKKDVASSKGEPEDKVGISVKKIATTFSRIIILRAKLDAHDLRHYATTSVFASRIWKRALSRVPRPFGTHGEARREVKRRAYRVARELRAARISRYRYLAVIFDIRDRGYTVAIFLPTLRTVLVFRAIWKASSIPRYPAFLCARAYTAAPAKMYSPQHVRKTYERGRTPYVTYATD